MAVITISRGSYSRGKEVAEKVAQRLGYDCISRDILLDASELFHIPEVKLARAIHDAPSILERFTYGKERYIAYIEAALLKFLREDHIVYHGLAGHFFIRNIPHVLKVRIISDWQDRVKLEMEREGISDKEAHSLLKKDDEQRRKWSQFLYGIDTADAGLYDLVLHIQKLTTDDAADIICQTVQMDRFQTRPESLKAMDDLCLAAQVKAHAVDLCPYIDVTSNDGIVHMKIKTSGLSASDLMKNLEQAALAISGVRQVTIEAAALPRYPD